MRTPTHLCPKPLHYSASPTRTRACRPPLPHITARLNPHRTPNPNPNPVSFCPCSASPTWAMPSKPLHPESTPAHHPCMPTPTTSAHDPSIAAHRPPGLCPARLAVGGRSGPGGPDADGRWGAVGPVLLFSFFSSFWVPPHYVRVADTTPYLARPCTRLGLLCQPLCLRNSNCIPAPSGCGRPHCAALRCALPAFHRTPPTPRCRPRPPPLGAHAAAPPLAAPRRYLPAC